MSEAMPPVEPPSSPALADIVAADASVETPPLPLRSWGVWATLGWVLLAHGLPWGGLYLGWKLFLFIAGPGLDLQQLSNHSYGLILLLWYCLDAALMLAVFAAAIRLKKWRLAEYVGLVHVPARTYLYALLAIFAFIVFDILIGYVISRSPPQWLWEIWLTRRSLLLFLFVVVVLAPLTEEICFRGFMFRGLAGTKWGPALPIVVTAAVWAVLHSQYDWAEVVIIFLAGLLLGWVRHRTGSIAPTVLMHMTMNLVSVVVFIIFCT